MDGNVDPEGIRLDLEWLHRVGVRGVQMFDGGMGTPLVVPEKVSHGSPEWQDAVRLATTTARRLGLEFAVATSAGWSAAGGPWVQPADAMKKVVWSTDVGRRGRPRSSCRSPRCPTSPGRTRTARAGAPTRAPAGTAQDWVTLAVPADALPGGARARPRSPRPTPSTTGRPLLDGSFAGAVSLPRDPDGPSSAWVEQGFDAPVTVGAVTVGLPGPGGFGAAPPPRAVLQASDDGDTWTVVAELAASGTGGGRAGAHRRVPAGDGAASGWC